MYCSRIFERERRCARSGRNGELDVVAKSSSTDQKCEIELRKDAQNKLYIDEIVSNSLNGRKKLNCKSLSSQLPSVCAVV
jgi:hypothetical protein